MIIFKVLVKWQKAGTNGQFSQWGGVSRGIPQALLLRLMLSNLFINYLDEQSCGQVCR